MTRTPLVAVIAVLVVAAGVAPLVAAATSHSPAEDIQPGERLAGVVGVQGTELTSNMEQRTFGHRMAAANSNASKASVVAQTVENLEQRLAELEQRKATLEEALANGSITQGEFAARMAQLMAEERALTRMLNTTADAANGLPTDVLEANGVNVSAIQELRTNAQNLTGEEVSAIARQIAGPPDDVGPPTDRGNNSTVTAAIHQAENAIQVAETRIDNAANRVAADNENLQTAQDKLDEAKAALSDARAAAAAGDTEEALALATEARDLARDAADLARQAVVDGGGEGEDGTTEPPTGTTTGTT